MSYGFNSNSYQVLKTCKYRDVFRKKSIELSIGDIVGSAIANAIIVTETEQESTYDLEGQAYIDKMVELRYIDLVTP